jgi:acyl-CoA synthetase (AMP-forming)/AMP-acid ligase II/acyl carrier protein
VDDRESTMDVPAAEIVTANLETRLLRLVEEVVRELNPSRTAPIVLLDSRLDRDLGIDSIGRAELVVRIEGSFGVTLAMHTLAEAETPRDLLSAVLSGGKTAGIRQSRAPRAPVNRDVITVPTDVGTLCAALDWHVQHHPDRPHIIFEETDAEAVPISYRALAERARRAAGGLREIDIADGDRVAIMLPTGEEFFVAFFSALYAGAIPVPIYPPARASQIEEHLRHQAGILGNAGAKVLLTSPQMRGTSGLLRSLLDSLAQVTSVDALPGAADRALPRILEPERTALIQYTSGSTGAPKGVVLSHSNILANIQALGTALAVTSDDTFISWLPVYHDLGLIGAWLGSLYYGAPLVVMPPQRFLLRPERWLWTIHRHRGTLSAAPNFAFDLCVRNIDAAAIEGLDLSSLRVVANGSEPVSTATLQRFSERFERYGFRPEAMAPAYGLAENTVGLTLPPRGRAPLIDRISRRRLRETGVAEAARVDEPAPK